MFNKHTQATLSVCVERKHPGACSPVFVRTGTRKIVAVTDDKRQWRWASLVLLSYKFDEVFKDSIAINHPEFLSDNFSRGDSDIFISFKLDERYYYILEIKDSKWSKAYARIFYSGISGLLDLYLNHQEKISLKNEISTIKQKRVKPIAIAQRLGSPKIFLFLSSGKNLAKTIPAIENIKAISIFHPIKMI